MKLRESSVNLTPAERRSPSAWIQKPSCRLPGSPSGINASRTLPTSRFRYRKDSMIIRVTRRLRKKRIVILGGGFGGVYAAIHLEKLLARESTVEICLVSRDNFFLFTPMLHEIAASDLEVTNIVNPLRKLLHKVEVLVGDVNELDLPNSRVTISHSHNNHLQVLHYDHLVIALGSVTNFYNLPGLAESAIPMKSLHDAIRLR